MKSLERLQTSLNNSLNQSIQIGKNAKCIKTTKNNNLFDPVCLRNNRDVLDNKKGAK